jgi:hypothetical protein
MTGVRICSKHFFAGLFIGCSGRSSYAASTSRPLDKFLLLLHELVRQD